MLTEESRFEVLGTPNMSNPYLAIQVVMMPRDTNPHGTIFGGVLLSYIDQAGALGAVHAVIEAGGEPPAVVTVAINRVEFHQPVLVGDVVRFLTSVVRIGRTSITMQVRVEAERGKQVLHVTQAELVYVGVDLSSPERRPRPLLKDSK
jgi:acyl-CoA thioesterase YciA